MPADLPRTTLPRQPPAYCRLESAINLPQRSATPRLDLASARGSRGVAARSTTPPLQHRWISVRCTSLPPATPETPRPQRPPGPPRPVRPGAQPRSPGTPPHNLAAGRGVISSRDDVARRILMTHSWRWFKPCLIQFQPSPQPAGGSDRRRPSNVETRSPNTHPPHPKAPPSKAAQLQPLQWRPHHQPHRQPHQHNTNTAPLIIRPSDSLPRTAPPGTPRRGTFITTDAPPPCAIS